MGHCQETIKSLTFHNVNSKFLTDESKIGNWKSRFVSTGTRTAEFKANGPYPTAKSKSILFVLRLSKDEEDPTRDC